MATPQQDDWMRRVLGAELASAGPPPLDLQALSERLRNVRDDAALHGAAAQFAAELRDAVGLLRAGDPAVVDLIDRLEDRVAEAARQARGRAAADAVAAGRTAGGAGVVEFAKLRLRLATARSAFDETVGTLKAAFEALLETDDFVGDPRSREPATLAAIAALDRKLPSFPDLAVEVEDTIDRMASSADPAQRSAHAQAALQAIERFKAQVRADPLLNEMERTDAGDYPMVAPMIEALDGVAAALRG